MPGKGRLMGVVYFARLESHLALIAGVTSFSCRLLESWPSGSMSRLLNPNAGYSLGASGLRVGGRRHETARCRLERGGGSLCPSIGWFTLIYRKLFLDARSVKGT